jgi:hypothetical protein
MGCSHPQIWRGRATRQLHVTIGRSQEINKVSQYKCCNDEAVNIRAWYLCLDQQQRVILFDAGCSLINSYCFKNPTSRANDITRRYPCSPGTTDVIKEEAVARANEPNRSLCSLESFQPCGIVNVLLLLFSFLGIATPLNLLAPQLASLTVVIA